MTNNCDIATAVAAEELGIAAEILSDAWGAIHLANEIGKVWQAAAQERSGHLRGAGPGGVRLLGSGRPYVPTGRIRATNTCRPPGCRRDSTSSSRAVSVPSPRS